MEELDRLSTMRNELVRRLGSQRYELLVGTHTSLECVDGVLRIGSPSQFQMQWLRRRLHDTLKECCRRAWGEDLAIEYHVAPAVACPTPTGDSVESVAADDAAPVEAAPVEATPVKKSLPMRTTASPSNRLSRPANSQPPHAARRVISTFENYVAGKGNELALRTAQSIAAQPGQYGPLLLYGPPGVGKTHLHYAILHQLRQANPPIHALRLTAEQFTAEFLSALDRRTLPGFRHKYRSIDVLLVDDVQFLAGKKATLDEMLYTIDTLHERSRQVVLACDRSPGELQSVSMELVARISGGLAIPLTPPDYATRVGIVRQFATRLKMVVNEEIVATIATQVAGSARQLQGALNRLAATSAAHGQPVTASLARTVTTEFVQQNTPAVRLVDIQRAVCQVFGVEATSLKSQRKTRNVAEPRMLAMWLARKYTRAALGEIGEFFGRRSHSTVISAHRKVEALVSQGAALCVADRPCHVEEAIRQVELALRTA
jgi:chromosomal replication initiator protein